MTVDFRQLVLPNWTTSASRCLCEYFLQPALLTDITSPSAMESPQYFVFIIKAIPLCFLLLKAQRFVPNDSFWLKILSVCYSRGRTLASRQASGVRRRCRQLDRHRVTESAQQRTLGWQEPRDQTKTARGQGRSGCCTAAEHATCWAFRNESVSMHGCSRFARNWITVWGSLIKVLLHTAINRADFVSWCMLYTYVRKENTFVRKWRYTFVGEPRSVHTKIDLSSLWESVHTHLDRSQFAFERSHSDRFGLRWISDRSNSLVWMAPKSYSPGYEIGPINRSV